MREVRVEVVVVENSDVKHVTLKFYVYVMIFLTGETNWLIFWCQVEMRYAWKAGSSVLMGLVNLSIGCVLNMIQTRLSLDDFLEFFSQEKTLDFFGLFSLAFSSNVCCHWLICYYCIRTTFKCLNDFKKLVCKQISKIKMFSVSKNEFIFSFSLHPPLYML